MKSLSFLILFALLFSFSATTAQTNAVELKDGSGTFISSHASIAAAYSAIPATLTSAYIIELTSAYTGSAETYPIIFTVKSGASASNTITIRPAAGVTAVSITGTASSQPLLRLDDADWIVIDGRPGGVGTSKALTISNLGTSSTSYGLHYINGACNNVVRYTNITGYATASAGGKGVYIQTSASNVTGNSDNTFEYVKFHDGPRTAINSSGTVANKNNNLVIFGCEFINTRFAAWWQQNGTGKVTIDSCQFYFTTASGSSSTGTFMILSDFQSDTTIITRNQMYGIDNGTHTSDVLAMAFRSFNAGSVLSIHNNMVSLMVSNASSNRVLGMELGTNSANSPVHAEIHYNTIRIGGTASGGSSGNLGSAAFSLDATNAGSVINGSNNILLNERTGGNEQHVTVALITTNGTITSDNNTYNTGSSGFSLLGTTLVPTFGAHQTAVAPQDALSNLVTVNFVSTTDLHLTGASVGDIALQGTFVPGISSDIDNQPRTFPYKGADEAGGMPPGCNGSPLSHQINLISNDTICLTDQANMAVLWDPQDSIDFTSIRWQISSDGIAFSDLPAALDDTLLESIQQTSWFRYIAACTLNGDSTISDTVMITVTQDPVAGTFSFSNTGLDYTFSAGAVQFADSIFWDFGDGSGLAGTDDTVSHTFSGGGTYTVTMIAVNNCGADTAELTFTDYTGVEEAGMTSAAVKLFPNPANGYVSVELPAGVTLIEASVYDLTGRTLIRSGAVSASGTISLSGLSNGTYLMKLTTNQGTVVKPFLIKN